MLVKNRRQFVIVTGRQKHMSIRSTPLTLAASSAKGNCPILADSSELGAILLPNNSLQQKHTSELKPSRVSLIYSSAEDYANDNAQIINFNAVSIFIKGNFVLRCATGRWTWFSRARRWPSWAIQAELSSETSKTSLSRASPNWYESA